MLLSTGQLIILGDFNFHVEERENSLAAKFINLLESFNLNQNVVGSTHQRGHTLDLIITRSDESLVSNIECFNPLISDHYAVLFNVAVERPEPVTKNIKYRSIKKINFGKFREDIRTSSLVTTQSTGVDDLSTIYMSELTRILDHHAPLKSKLITDRTGCEWFTDELGDLKREKRKLERKYNSSKLTVDLEIYRNACATYQTHKNVAKCNYYTNKVNSGLNDQSSIFQIINNLMHKTSASPLPEHDSPSSLAQDFADFFNSKIDKIYHHLESIEETGHPVIPDPEHQHLLRSFTLTTEDDILKIIKKSPIKSCPLDPIPAAVFKEVYLPLIPVLNKLVNLSLETGLMPCDMKVALINPILKKPSLDREILSNYRPVSNLTYV